MSTLFLLGLAIFLGFFAFATYRTNQLLQTWEPEENLLLAPAENLARLVFIALLIGLGLLSGEDPRLLGWHPQHPWQDMALGLALGVGMPLVLFYPSRWIETHHPQWYSDVVLRSIRPRNQREWPWVVLALLPVAIMEELLFRSLLLGAFIPHVNILYFVIGVSILFGLLHLPQGEWGVIGVILVSVILSLVFLWRESVLVVIVAHWLMNVMQLVLDATLRYN